MSFFKCKRIKSIILIFLTVSFFTSNLLLAWAPQVQSNYLKEAIRILPWFQYLMCKDYQNYLIEGIVEAEYQFWFFHGGNCPGLVENLKENKLKYIKGWNYQEEDIENIAEYFYKKFEGLKSSIRNGDNQYSEIMFKLGYNLHPINNCLKPPYLHTTKPTKEEIYYHNQCTRLANNTESIELKTENIDNIENLKSWLEEMLTKNLKLRNEWYKEASIDKSNYKKYTMLASEKNIYNLAGIINYVLGDLNPMTPEMKKFVYDKINKKFKGMRKPGI